MTLKELETRIKDKVKRKEVDETFWNLLYLYVQQDPEASQRIKDMPYGIFKMYFWFKMLNLTN